MKRVLYLLVCIMALTKVSGQEESPFVTYDVPSQNLLKFDRFLINPTYSTVREDKSYINLFHRNQSVAFDDNNQTYFLSYSGRIGDRSGLGLSLYTQRTGTISNYGVLANYAYGIKLSDKSNFTFGANLSYYNSGFDKNRANTVEDDPFLNGFQDSSLLSFQPGINISYGQFDFGLFAQNLFDYNLKYSKSITNFNEKTFSGQLQYTYELKNTSGIFEKGRLMPLATVRKPGQDDIVLGGSLILDLPKLGWVQGGYDSYYGVSAGVGFNLGKRISIGYTMENGVSNSFSDFGITHEISFAYSFTPTLTEDRVMLENQEEQVAENKEEINKDEVFTSKDEEIAELKRRLAENDEILAELMFRQDSLEANRQKDLERRFDLVMRMVRNETNGNRPDLEEKARQMYFVNNDKSEIELDTYGSAIVENKIDPKDIKPNGTNIGFQPKDVVTTKHADVRTRSTSAKDNIPTDDFAIAAKKNHIKNRTFQDLPGVAEGYYLVANVYKGELYLNKFINDLHGKGIDAEYFLNSRNGLKYVYLNRYDSWQQAIVDYKSHFNGTYTDDMWIMKVQNTTSTDKGYAANSDNKKDDSSKYAKNVLRKNIVVKDRVVSTTPTATQNKIHGTGTGYYIIANVFANPNNANRFVKLLNAQGLNASYFINPKNNYRYVYLKRHSTWTNALISYYSKLNDSYDQQMWIMRVTPNLIS
ncbi:PorP/SprF family type IX secretion system membrane protein [Flavobacteriaceae bacterium F89]|uniref:PorP/SprF family type IX secretion system membrane protein n=1 Tax=Cerina litoralis TaxID=2874477 RepID=A0AAE3ERU5_9FLAO|nr:PorP/SprF family type IX secretion system membrane protein [Cerina litoralis]MCG2459220.1 PorP/SprF family type IX secretion system membrane protein [Cerina litoralis]